jgi:DNA polymerase-3 subunit delta'
MLAELERHPNAAAVLGPVLVPGGAPSHAYLFHGPGGVGKRAVARAVAAAWLSDGEVDVEGARVRALHGSHPDLTWVSPSGAHEMLVSDIDAPVVAAASRTPFESARRVFVIESVDQLGDEAANRMLKTLEEPPSFVHLILITERLAEVLPTIRSRCQLVRFDAPSVAEIEAMLVAEGVEAGEPGSGLAGACARLCLGDVGRARELAAPDGAALRAAAEGFVRGALAGTAASTTAPPSAAILAAAKARGERVRVELEQRAAAELELTPKRDRKRVETEWGDRIRRGRRRAETGALDLALELVSAWLLDLAALAWGAEDLVRAVDRIAELRADGGRGVAALRRGVELVEDTRQRFQLNVSEDLACEALAFRLERLLA